MTHTHYEINLSGPWRLYSHVLPATCKPMGTIRSGPCDTGALVRLDDTGLFAQVNAGVIRPLDQNAVQHALHPSPKPLRKRHNSSFSAGRVLGFFGYQTRKHTKTGNRPGGAANRQRPG